MMGIAVALSSQIRETLTEFYFNKNQIPCCAIMF